MSFDKYWPDLLVGFSAAMLMGLLVMWLAM